MSRRRVCARQFCWVAEKIVRSSLNSLFINSSTGLKKTTGCLLVCSKYVAPCLNRSRLPAKSNLLDPSMLDVERGYGSDELEEGGRVCSLGYSAEALRFWQERG